VLEVENVPQSEVKGIVHGCVQAVVGIVGHIANITLEHLAYLVDAGGLSVFLPEIFLDMGDSINADSVEVELLDCVAYPVLEGLSYERIVLVKVRKVGEPAVLDLILVIPVVYLALGVVVLDLVEWLDDAVILVNPSHVVGHNIKHHPDVHGMSSINHVVEVVLCAEVRVHVVPVERTIAVVVVAEILGDRRNPDGVEAQILDVLKLVLDALEGATAIFAEISTGSCGTVCAPEAISDDLIDCS
jgi:hypothetical protein